MFELTDLVAVPFLILLFTVTTFALVRRNGADERRIILFSFAQHISFSLALRFSQGGIYGEGDLWNYRVWSSPLVELMRLDPIRYVPIVLGANFHIGGTEELRLAEYTSTTSMVMTMALGRVVMVDSIWGLYLLSAYGSFLAKWAMYAVFREELKSLDRRVIALATMCIPSVVFWTSGLVKEAYAFIGLGLALHGARQIIRARYLAGGAFAAAGAIFTATYKPYLLFPFSIGFSIWMFFERSRRSRTNALPYLLVGTGFGSILIIGLGAIFPQFSVSRISDQTASAQFYGEIAQGGSHFGGMEARSPAEQVLKAPLALLTSLTRPWPWEVTNVSSGIAAFEMLVLTFLLVWSVHRGGKDAIRAVAQTPIFLFCALFVGIGGVAVGLTTLNFGTLSRYRVPLVPFYAVAVAMVARRVSRTDEQIDPAGPTPLIRH